MRIEVFNKEKFRDGRAVRLLKSINSHVLGQVAGVSITDVYIVEGVAGMSTGDAKEIFSDPVAQEVSIDSCSAEKLTNTVWNYMIEVTSKPGVTDPVAITAREAVKNYTDSPVPDDAVFQTAIKYLIASPPLSNAEIEKLSLSLHNPLIQTASVIDASQWKAGKRFPAKYPHKVIASEIRVESIDLSVMNDNELAGLSKIRLLALSVGEMRAVKAYFSEQAVKDGRMKAGLPAGATDVELEMIAQTWSEHCKHKIFNATIQYDENGKKETIKSVFKTYIKKATEDLSKDRTFLRSVFYDNAGVIRFDDDTLLCFKVETHNSPSALDPYGGAITGIVGVNRDIMGTGRGARPIFNTNFLCFGFPDTPAGAIPRGILHPHEIMSGVHKGIIDGGNQSGIPVVAGGFLFDESYTGKPLVYCGTGGILPAKIGGDDAWKKEIKPGDLAVMTGGRIGKDGIHGATFSSQLLDEESPPSAVQIGDPITQKKMLDFLIEARDKGLFKGITDNGAGGLSSSLGEMASESNGIKIVLDKCPLKYQGLAPWEILVSESQERMSVAVTPDRIDAFLELAKSRDVEATIIGEFTDSGTIEVSFRDSTVALVSLDFLHNGLPVMELEASWKPNKTTGAEIPPDIDQGAMLMKILSDPNVASREELVRQYDHEVQSFSVVKPFVGEKEDSHSDGAVLRPKYDSDKGITVTHGICPRYGDYDTYDMAMCALDEAFRAHIALGGNPDEAAALDNFCWPDPIESDSNPDGRYKLAQLVRACKGLFDACIAYKIPLISGKDSMKNDALLDGKKISVRPTLLVSLIGYIDDVRNAVTTDFKHAGDLIYSAGETRAELGGSIFERITGLSFGKCPEVIPAPANKLYRAIHRAIQNRLIASCHDLSDGGLAVALAESALGGRLGLDVSLDSIPGKNMSGAGDSRILFCETPSRFVVTIPEAKQNAFEAAMTGLPVTRCGKVTEEKRMIVRRGTKIIIDSALEELERSWKKRIA
jgi:phosphoribosylformylglycinamidine synthase II